MFALCILSLLFIGMAVAVVREIREQHIHNTIVFFGDTFNNCHLEIDSFFRKWDILYEYAQR